MKIEKMKDGSVQVGFSIYEWLRDGHLYKTNGEKLGLEDEVDLALEEGLYTFNILQTDHLGYSMQLTYGFRGYDYDMQEVIEVLKFFYNNEISIKKWK